MKFMALYMAPASSIAEMMQNTTPADMQAGMDEWMGWAKKNEKTIADMGAPLGKTHRVTSAGASSAKNEITGFTVVEGDSAEAVAKTFKGHPHLKLKGAYIDIMDYVKIPGM